MLMYTRKNCQLSTFYTQMYFTRWDHTINQQAQYYITKHIFHTFTFFILAALEKMIHDTVSNGICVTTEEEHRQWFLQVTTTIVPNENLACCSIRSRKTLGSTLQNITTSSINVLSALSAALTWVSKQLSVLLQVLTLGWYIGGTDVSDTGKESCKIQKKGKCRWKMNH